jgi:hypothetical protein
MQEIARIKAVHVRALKVVDKVFIELLLTELLVNCGATLTERHMIC